MIEEIKTSYFNPTETLMLASRCLSVLPPEIIETLGLSAAVSTVNNGIEVLDKSLSRTQKSEYTHRLKAQGEVCTDAVRCLKLLAKSYRLSHVSSHKEAGILLYNVIDQHLPDVKALGYVKKMGKIKALASELEKQKYLDAIALLAMQVYVEHMVTAGEQFEAIYQEKNIAEADKNMSISTSDASKMVLESLIQLRKIINAHLLLNGSEELRQLGLNMNSVIESVSNASR